MENPTKFVLERTEIVNSEKGTTLIREEHNRTLEKIIDLPYEEIPKEGTIIKDGYNLFDRDLNAIGKLMVTSIEAGWDYVTNKFEYTVKLKKYE